MSMMSEPNEYAVAQFGLLTPAEKAALWERLKGRCNYGRCDSANYAGCSYRNEPPITELRGLGCLCGFCQDKVIDHWVDEGTNPFALSVKADEEKERLEKELHRVATEYAAALAAAKLAIAPLLAQVKARRQAESEAFARRQAELKASASSRTDFDEDI